MGRTQGEPTSPEPHLPTQHAGALSSHSQSWQEDRRTWRDSTRPYNVWAWAAGAEVRDGATRDPIPLREHVAGASPCPREPWTSGGRAGPACRGHMRRWWWKSTPAWGPTEACRAEPWPKPLAQLHLFLLHPLLE